METTIVPLVQSALLTSLPIQVAHELFPEHRYFALSPGQAQIVNNATDGLVQARIHIEDALFVSFFTATGAAPGAKAEGAQAEARPGGYM